MAAIRDVTERKQLEARYVTLVEGIPAVTFMAALDEERNKRALCRPPDRTVAGLLTGGMVGRPVPLAPPTASRRPRSGGRPSLPAPALPACSSNPNTASSLATEKMSGYTARPASSATTTAGRYSCRASPTTSLRASAPRSCCAARPRSWRIRSTSEPPICKKPTTPRGVGERRPSSLSGQHESRNSHAAQWHYRFFRLVASRKAETGDGGARWSGSSIIRRPAAQHLLALINDILDLTKVDAGKLIDLEAVSCSPIAKIIERGSAAVLRRPRPGKRGTMRIECGASTGRCRRTVRSDPTRLAP